MYSRRSGTGSPLLRAIFRIPAIRALSSQVIAFAAVLLLVFALPDFAGIQITIVTAALMQGGVAAMLARMLRLAPWWLPIQFLFPIALVGLSAVQLPPSIYLVAFLVLLAVYWSTFRTQVPFYPSGRATWRAVAELLPQERPLRIVDVGSGVGGLVMYLARQRPECQVVGIELAPLPWLCSRLCGLVSGSAGRFIRGDYEDIDFGDFDVVFAYLSPAAMPALWQKAHTEMGAGALLLSYEFTPPGVDPDMVVHPFEGGPALYGWCIP